MITIMFFFSQCYNRNNNLIYKRAPKTIAKNVHCCWEIFAKKVVKCEYLAKKRKEWKVVYCQCGRNVKNLLICECNSVENTVFCCCVIHTKSPSTLRRRYLRTQQSLVILNVCFRKVRKGKSHDFRDVMVF